jgi:hypothetical protein
MYGVHTMLMHFTGSCVSVGTLVLYNYHNFGHYPSSRLSPETEENAAAIFSILMM